MADGAAIEADLGQAIADTLAKHEGGFVTKWVALIETVDPDGERGLWAATSDDVKAWDTMGLLQYGLQLQVAQTLHGDEDD